MKTQLYTGLILSLLASCATPQPEFGDFAHATPARDTLYLVHNDSLSEIVKRTWDTDTVRTRPCIKFVNVDEMASIKKRLSYGKSK
jgi:hypothetical protein